MKQRSHSNVRHAARGAWCAALLACALWTAAAQAGASQPAPQNQSGEPNPSGEPGPTDESKPAPAGPRPGGDDAVTREMVELFGKVERRLREIDSTLYDAGGGKPLGKLEESGIGELLKSARDSSGQVLQDIDRMLDLAQQQASQSQPQSGGSSGSSSQQSSSGPSEGDQQQGSRGDREQTPEGPGTSGEPQGARPEEQGQPQDGELPDGTQESPRPGENGSGTDPRAGPTERVDASRSDDRWGDLPIQVRDLFRAQGGGDLPPRYREWIDSYYRRLNETR